MLEPQEALSLWMWQLHEPGPGQAEETPLVSFLLLHRCDMGQKSPCTACSPWGLPAEATAPPSGSITLTSLPEEVSKLRPQHSRVPGIHAPPCPGKSASSSLPHCSLGTGLCSPFLFLPPPSCQSGSGSERFPLTTATLVLERCN